MDDLTNNFINVVTEVVVSSLIESLMKSVTANLMTGSIEILTCSSVEDLMDSTTEKCSEGRIENLMTSVVDDFRDEDGIENLIDGAIEDFGDRLSVVESSFDFGFDGEVMDHGVNPEPGEVGLVCWGNSGTMKLVSEPKL